MKDAPLNLILTRFLTFYFSRYFIRKRTLSERIAIVNQLSKAQRDLFEK